MKVVQIPADKFNAMVQAIREVPLKWAEPILQTINGVAVVDLPDVPPEGPKEACNGASAT